MLVTVAKTKQSYSETQDILALVAERTIKSEKFYISIPSTLLLCLNKAYEH